MADFEDTNEEEREISKCIPNRIVPNGSVLQNVPGFVARLNDLIRLAEKESFENSENSPLLEVCQELYHSGEAMAVSVDREVRRRLSVQEQCHATSDAFQLSLQRLVYLNKVCKELEEKVTQQQKQIDKTESNKRRRLKPAETKEPKHPVGGRMGISPHFSSAPPTSSQTLPARGSVRDVNTYEDFQKKVMPEILYASLPNQVTPSSAGTRVFGPVRKARSETDLRESELEKELKVLFVHVGLCCPLMIRICTMQVALREERGGLYALRIIIRSNTVCYNTAVPLLRDHP
jgi:hypothetical protein